MEQSSRPVVQPAVPTTAPYVTSTFVLFNNTSKPGNFLATDVSPATSATYDAGKGEVFISGSGGVGIVSDSTNEVVASVSLTGFGDGVYDGSKGEVWLDGGPGGGPLLGQISAISDVTDTIVASVTCGWNPAAPAYDSVKGELFVPNHNSNNLTVISDTSDSVVATIPLSGMPWQAAYDSGKGEIFVAVGNSVDAISDSTNTVVASVPVGARPVGVVYDPGTSEIFVSNSLSSNVSVISDASTTVVATVPLVGNPDDLTYDIGTSQVLVSIPSYGVSVISDATNTVVTTIQDALTPYGVAYDGGRSEVFAADYKGSNVSIISDSSDSIVSTLAVGASPADVVFDSGRSEAFVVDTGENMMEVMSTVSNSLTGKFPLGHPSSALYDSGKGEVFVSDTLGIDVLSDTSNQLVARIPLPSTPGWAAYDSAKGEVFVADGGGLDRVFVISDSTNSVIATLSVGTYPTGIVYDSGNGEIFVANDNTNNISVISDTTNSVVATIGLHFGPYELAYDGGKGEIFVTASCGGNVSVISDSTDKEVANILGMTCPAGLAYDRGTGDVYIADSGGLVNAVKVVSDSTNSVVSTLPVGLDPERESYDPIDGQVIVANALQGTLSVLDDGSSTGTTLSSVAVSPASATLSFGGASSFVATPTCSGGPCPSGTAYSWSMNRVLGSLNSTTGSVVKFKAGSTGGTTYLFVNATLNGVTVQSVAVPIVIASGSVPRYILNFTVIPPPCPMTFNGTTQANGTSAIFLPGNYTGIALACPGYYFHDWGWRIGAKGLVTTQNPLTLYVNGNGSVTLDYSVGTPWKDSLTFLLNRAACPPISFNGTGQSNGTMGAFLSGTYTARALPCSGLRFSTWEYQPSGSTSLYSYPTVWANISIFANGTLTAYYAPSPTSYVLLFSVNHASCSPVEFNGSSVANGSSGSYIGGTYPAYLPPCSGFRPHAWHWQPAGEPSTDWFTSGWANVSVGFNGTLTAIYWALPHPLTVSLTTNVSTLISGGTALLSPFISGGTAPFVCSWSLNGTNTSEAGCTAATLSFAHPATYTYLVWTTDASATVAGSNAVVITVIARSLTAPPLVAFANETMTQGHVWNNCTSGARAIPAPPGYEGWGDSFVGNARGGSPPYSFLWSFGDGTTGAGRNVTHLFEAGTFSIVLRVTDVVGRAAWANLTLIVMSVNGPACQSTGFSLLGLSPTASLLLITALVAVAVGVLLTFFLVRRRRTGSERSRAPPPVTEANPGEGLSNPALGNSSQTPGTAEP